MPRRAKSAPAASIFDLESLLSKASTGDRDAFIEIYDRMAARVLGVIRRILEDSAQSEQVLEDVFAGLWRESRAGWDGEASVAAWLMFRARRAALDRRAGRTTSRAKPAISCEGVAWVPGAEAIRRIEQRRPLLAKVLSQLPREQLESLDLVVFSGRAEDEVAEQLHQPLAKVKSELRAAARFLRHRRHAVVGSWAVNI
jgi:RNA polymerase sigma-70 factor (ECF subfamily)